MNNLDKAPLNLLEAIESIKEGKTVFTIINKYKTYLYKVSDIYLLKNENSALRLTESNLVVSFAGAIFYVEDITEVFVDPLKDDEYYSWKQ